MPGLLHVDPPQNDLKWGITASQNALSWPHVDANGLATTVTVTTGSKYWIMMKKRRSSNAVPGLGDLATLEAFPKSWHPSRFERDMNEYEAIYLTAGTSL
jgi:hypothetical protein